MQSSFLRIGLGRAAAALLALGLAAGAGAAPLPLAPLAPSADLRCGSGIAPAALPANYPAQVQPPAAQWKAFHPDGSYNWAAGYDLQAMVFHLIATGDASWAARLVDAADTLLAQRDAPSPVDQQPYAWFDRSANLTQPYVWLAYAGHNFAPLMQFARVVTADPRVGSCVYRGKPLRSYARAYLQEFDRVLRAHRSEMVRQDGYTYFVFGRPVPVRDGRLQGAALPVNMNADVFLAMLHSVPVEAALGSAETATKRRGQVEEYARYLTRSVVQHVPCLGERTCLQWHYATYMPRADDVGHSNIVAKFLLDAHEDGYGVQRSDLVAYANTIDNLVAPDGTFRGNLLDGESVPGVSQEIFYVILYAPFSDRLRAKLGPLVAGSRSFAYAGAWLQSLEIAGAAPARVRTG